MLSDISIGFMKDTLSGNVVPAIFFMSEPKSQIDYTGVIYEWLT